MQRFSKASRKKTSGATYTPASLADFVVSQMLYQYGADDVSTLNVLDPAIGEGSLIKSLLMQLPPSVDVNVVGYDIDSSALSRASDNIRALRPSANLNLRETSFLADATSNVRLASTHIEPRTFDLIIANPPYVRTHHLNDDDARRLAERYQIKGRIDLYHVFMLALADHLAANGVLGLIVSNRFITTKGGASVRKGLLERYDLKHIVDLGDTKPFDAAVLPAVVIAKAKGPSGGEELPVFTSVYSTTKQWTRCEDNLYAALSSDGIVRIDNGGVYEVVKGELRAEDREMVWRLANSERDDWLRVVASRTQMTFRDIGKVRVGVKTCADKVFIRDDWHLVFGNDSPELLRPVTTHHIADRIRARISPLDSMKRILYPHEYSNGRRKPADLDLYPKSQSYLEQHRHELESRTYLADAGRAWYEVWVPQDPRLWQRSKIVFRDISETPCFWLDTSGSIVNGDCYWMVADNPMYEDLLWVILAVANSTFIEDFYDMCFNNKLYAGRRRFVSQYVERFPIPKMTSSEQMELIGLVKSAYSASTPDEFSHSFAEIDHRVSQLFSVPHRKNLPEEGSVVFD